MHVPLLIRFPEKYQDLAPAAAGATTDRLVSFVDFGPTVLLLGGVEIPEWMQGRPFLGKEAASPREYVFGHRDRVDEMIDLARSARSGRFLYIRNYMPHLGYGQQSAWIDQGEIRKDFYAAAEAGDMSPAQWHYMSPERAVEELYDCEADPMNLENLARDPEHAEALEKLRGALASHLRETRDAGFLPEAEWWNRIEDSTVYERARDPLVYPQELLIEAASAVGSGDPTVLIKNLAHDEAGVRYWGAVGLAAMATRVHGLRTGHPLRRPGGRFLDCPGRGRQRPCAP